MSRGSKLRWLWRAPARALGRARDMYVRGVTGCSRYMPADAAFGYPVIVPASLSTRSRCDGWAGGAEEDLRQLVRAASQRQVEQRRAAEMVQQQAVARSRSVAAALSMARIDEDAPCEFGDDADGDGGAGALYLRSQSCVGSGEAVRRTRACHRKVVALG